MGFDEVAMSVTRLDLYKNCRLTGRLHYHELERSIWNIIMSIKTFQGVTKIQLWTLCTEQLHKEQILTKFCNLYSQ